MVMVSTRDKRLSVWVALQLALVLVHSHSVRALSCRGAEWREDRIQDLESSWTGITNTSLTLQAVHPTLDKETCTQLCCQSASGNCTSSGLPVQSSSINGTCYLYSCVPALPFCIFTNANGSEVVLTSLPLEKGKRIPEVAFASTVAAVVGDGTQSKGRKGVLSEMLDDQPLLKHDNTSVKPRKGVFKEHSVNGRKGVEKDTLIINSELFSDDPGVTNTSFDSTNTSQTTVITLIDDVINETQSKLSTLDKMTTPSLSRYDPALNSSDVSDEEQTNTTLVLLSSSISKTSPVQIASSDKVTESSNTYALPLISSIKPSVHDITEEASVSAITQEGKSNEAAQDSDDVSWEMNQSNTAMHLVIGLVLGLMVLLTVIGIVAKRVHDSWQRRHYHRMDFLIDGMYHGNP